MAENAERLTINEQLNSEMELLRKEAQVSDKLIGQGCIFFGFSHVSCTPPDPLISLK